MEKTALHAGFKSQGSKELVNPFLRFNRVMMTNGNGNKYHKCYFSAYEKRFVRRLIFSRTA